MTSEEQITSEDLPFSIREAKQEDYPFILASWSNDAHHLKFDNFIPNSIFFPRQKNLINKILMSSVVLVCHMDDNIDDIVGYIVLEPRGTNTLLIHWAHVKPIYRKHGVFKSLLKQFIQEADPILVCTSPFALLPEFKDKFGLIYDPSRIDHLRVL